MKFRMVDRITEFKARERICGIKTVSFEEYQLKSVFGGEPQLPESLVMESMFQLGNWLIMLSSDYLKIGLIIRFEEIEFTGIVCPGHHLDMEANIRSYREDGIVFDGKATVDGAVIALGRGCLALPVPLNDYVDPEDVKMLFSEIYKPKQELAESNR